MTEETINDGEELEHSEEGAEGQEAEGAEQGAAEDAKLTLEEHAEEDGRSDEEREKIRERRRQERHEKKEAQREREATMRRELAARDHELNDLKGRLAVMEKKSQAVDVSQVDQALKQAGDAYHYFKGQIAEAVQAQNGVVAADATEKMLVAQRRYEDLNRIKQSVAKQESQPAPLDPRVAAQAKAWLDKNKWYDPAGSDEDSYVAAQIDKRVAQEGWNPATPQYWEELDARLKAKNVGVRSKQGYNKSSSGKSPVAGSGRSSAPAAGGGSYQLSAERVQALKDSGKWEDPTEREKMIKYYKNYDKSQSATRA
jgi:hypothetical protein